MRGVGRKTVWAEDVAPIVDRQIQEPDQLNERNMRCPKCGREQTDVDTECPTCGIILAKWRRQQALSRPGQSVPPATVQPITEDTDSGILKALLFPMPATANPISLGARVLLLVVLTLWGLYFIFTPIASKVTMSSFWHLVNLPFHEAGHIFFRPFAQFQQVIDVPVLHHRMLLHRFRHLPGNADVHDQ